MNSEIEKKIESLVESAEESLRESFLEIDRRTFAIQKKVLKAFIDNRVSDSHFAWRTGYGYNDDGRDIVEKVYAQVFSAEKALVRTNIVNGTHAISLAILGVLKAGDKLLYCTGEPYDTLQSIIGTEGAPEPGTLRELEIDYGSIELIDGEFDYDSIEKIIKEENPKMLAIQRSTGYGWRKTITVNQIEEFVNLVRSLGSSAVIMIDNCYCEFISLNEPSAVGADIVCGSLIKNPGGGLALSGGYIVGREDLIDRIAFRLTCPGIGSECGLTFGQTRAMLQGFFMAPHITAGALKSAILLGEVYSKLGFEICPDSSMERADIIQAIRLGSPEAVSAFCKGVQSASPIDSFAAPVASEMPGYDDDIIMAAGTFVQGASIELSADGPMREPYNVYYQGALTYEHGKIGLLSSLKSLEEEGILDI
ncbi:MAG: methionine gamma-lyase family protein [Firmicutes bacterium]|nr:methionine gamma-lyase family protein [Bacillota bacterium]